MAAIVPVGIEREASAKSPERFDPAMIPFDWKQWIIGQQDPYSLSLMTQYIFNVLETIYNLNVLQKYTQYAADYHSQCVVR